MLTDIKALLEQRGSASPLDLANHFRLAPNALHGMLDHWIRKGAVVQDDISSPCAVCGAEVCCGCSDAGCIEIYAYWGAT